MEKILRVLNIVLLSCFLFLGVFFLVFGFGSKYAFFTTFGSFFVSLLISKFLRKKNVYGQGYLMFFVNFILLLNIFGEFWAFFLGITYYDKSIHFFNGILIGAILFALYKRDLKSNRYYIFLSGLGIFVIWEIYEYIMTVIFGVPMMGVYKGQVVVSSPLDDTMIDIICNAVGSIIYLFFKK
jgi:hypothetical protein